MRITKYFVLETGFAHRTTEDDIHDGYYIPKGSWVFPNAWLVTQLECYHLSHSSHTLRTGLCFVILVPIPTRLCLNPNGSFLTMRYNLRWIRVLSVLDLDDGIVSPNTSTILSLYVVRRICPGQLI